MTERPPLLPSALGLITLLIIFSLHFLIPIATVFPQPSNFIAFLPFSVGIVLVVAAGLEMAGMCNSDNLGTDAPVRLVTTGVYAFSRNPGYLGAVLFAIGLAAWVGSLSPWLVIAFLPKVMSGAYIRREEKELEARFGDSYRFYCRAVPRWFSLKRKRLNQY